MQTSYLDSSDRVPRRPRRFFAELKGAGELSARIASSAGANNHANIGEGEEAEQQITRTNLFALFALLVIVSFLLRIFYAGHLYQDDGFWFASAEEILRGKALYREIYFDKPPLLPLLYALLFKAFGAHILTIRLFTIFYSVAVSAVLYALAKRLYNSRIACLAAAMFVVFSTTYTTGHVQGLNTDFLMLLPYAAGAYLVIRTRSGFGEGNPAASKLWFALLGGALAGIAFQVNPKAGVDLVFFGIFLVISRRWSGISALPRRRDVAATSLFALALAGFVAAGLPFIAYLGARQSLGAYWQYVWAWGSRYAAYYPASDVLASALRQSIAYFGLNNTLLVGLAFVTATTIRGSGPMPNTTSVTEEAAVADSRHRRLWRSDLTLLVWFAVSFAGLSVGGRFYGHYFFQIMPSLCLIGARGLNEIGSAIQRRGTRRVVLALLAIGFAVTIVRFHGRTAVLAMDWFRGTRSEITAGWYHERLNREERRVAAVVRELPDKEESADEVGMEGIRLDAAAREAGGPNEYLFVWGYRPEIYYWSGLLPASRYLSTQALTGIPADVHYFENERRLLFDEAITAQAREQLVRDLEETRPRYIIDELGMFNPELSLEDYPELHEFMESYRHYGTTDRFEIYRRREERRKR